MRAAIRIGRFTAIVACALVLLTTALAITTIASAASDLPSAKPDGARWRVGYVEGEPFVNFAGNLYGVLKGLEELGWIDDLASLPYVSGGEDSRAMWDWLAQANPSRQLEFVQDAYWSFASDHGEQAALERLRDGEDLDFVLVMGTYAGVTLASDEHDVPLMVLSSSDPVGAGIVASEEDSGREHVWAFVDPGRSRRQILVFHDIFGFERMGMVHEDSELGRIYSSAEQVEAVARERGFTIDRVFVSEPDGEADRRRYFDELLQAHEALAARVDAMLITVASIDPAWLPQLLEPFYRAGVPVFSQLGIEEVEQGALISVARSEFVDMGRFAAKVMVEALNGASLRSIPMVYTEAPRIAVNLRAAELIGFQVPFEVLLVADYVYHEIPGEHTPADGAWVSP